MILSVVKAPHPRLRKICAPADPKLAHHRTLARRLVETMKSYKAYGIAANQVFPGELVCIIAVNTSAFKGAMFNPEITASSSEVTALKEGCLSLKREYSVFRPKMITVKFLIMTGEPKEMTFSGLDAIVIQHEMDHLKGILASDYDPIDKTGHST